MAANVTDRTSVRAMLDDLLIAYGGLDSKVVPPDKTGHIPDDRWALTFAINVTGGYLVADEAEKFFASRGSRHRPDNERQHRYRQKGSLAYDTSKAAANHLVRKLAIELSPLVRVNGVAPDTVVKGSAMFPRDRQRGNRITRYSCAS